MPLVAARPRRDSYLASLNKLLSDLMGSTDEVCVAQQQDAFVKSDNNQIRLPLELTLIHPQ
ncbi:hypothetical protein MNBD_PLANCTO02-1231 [hydrothermal vent metagenome]|uniref:Uncharacterized protein n=2 Tax=hydrothermal vent metagenome TaxID=652676 RepID=A0A3B1E301_9ZZZZ